MGISYKLDKFEGPLDLLLHLIEKNKVNIYDIPIVLITQQYLTYVSSMDREDLNIVSDFLVMAATLLDIKSRMLLPASADEEEEIDDPRADLVTRLLEYKLYKYMSFELQDRQVEAQKLLFKPPTIPKEVSKYEPPVELDKLLDGLTLARLQRIFDGIMKRQEDKMDPIRSKFGNIQKEPISLEDKIDSIMDYARKHRVFKFSTIIHRYFQKTELVLTFLAILELMKIGKIQLSQEFLFDDMLIETIEPKGETGSVNSLILDIS